MPKQINEPKQAELLIENVENTQNSVLVNSRIGTYSVYTTCMSCFTLHIDISSITCASLLTNSDHTLI